MWLCDISFGFCTSKTTLLDTTFSCDKLIQSEKNYIPGNLFPQHVDVHETRAVDTYLKVCYAKTSSRCLQQGTRPIFYFLKRAYARLCEPVVMRKFFQFQYFIVIREIWSPLLPPSMLDLFGTRIGYFI